MSQMKLKRLSLKAFYAVEKKVDKRYTNEVLGGKPSRSSIEKKNPNKMGVSVMEWAALIFLAFLAMFAIFKVVPTAAEYAVTFFTGEQIANLPSFLADGFKWATIFVLALMNSVGFIFFKLQTEDVEILRKQRENPVKSHRIRLFGDYIEIPNIWQIQVWSPRMYELLTYIVLAWQLLIAITGIHDYGQAIQWANAILPVLAEIAMATLVATILKKVQDRNMEVTTLLLAAADEYEERFNMRRDDERYLTILFQELREKLLSMRSNQALEFADSEHTRRVIMSEYERLTAGIEFARDVFNLRSERKGVATEIVADSAEAQAVHSGKRRPPRGHLTWTVDDLINEFRKMGLTPDSEYTEKDMQSHFEGGYGWRPAFRGKRDAQGAKKFFRMYQ